ncbi:zinc finger protein 276 [Anguilla anguilla]|uniref:zinc finger protein 276 n=1 Tax=Anguilla anguilla TaxID=7936 RepID=UPI0015ACEDFB|nr:zinc finger protein 276 [Anguilla anguilla]
MKRDRRARLAAVSPLTRHAHSPGASKRPCRRGRPRAGSGKNAPRQGCELSRRDDDPGESAWGGRLSIDTIPATGTGEAGGPQNESRTTGSGRLSAAFCRLCHGKFSPRSLRHAFGKLQGESVKLAAEERLRPPPLFCTDFQRLVGVPVSRDPLLSQFVCKNCHSQFYKCHRVLLTFLQRVNLSPSTRDSATERGHSMRSYSAEGACLSGPPITSSPQCLHGLVSWTHHHAVDCSSCPGLQEVLEGQYRGAVRVVWGCVDGHSYTMDAQAHPERDQQAVRTGSPDSGTALRPVGAALTHPSPAAAPQNQAPALRTAPSTDTAGASGGALRSEATVTPAPADPVDGAGESDLSDRNFSSDDEDEERRKSGSSDELFEPFPEKRVVSSKKGGREAKRPPEPKVRKKPGPKPGWKKKIKTEREELPNIYKCPHQGCTAVYRGADGMKKHIKEHHEEVRERPCPHPGCNKVFMIDRYLQRHVKLIHTEVRNYICDQCGQTFKQRKHLSVHQMRHSGAKPLQCEVCGFQCRQRASLKYHMTKHKAEAELEFACEQCGKRFEKAHNLNVHMSMVHPLTQGGASDPPQPPEGEALSPHSASS